LRVALAAKVDMELDKSTQNLQATLERSGLGQSSEQLDSTDGAADGAEPSEPVGPPGDDDGAGDPLKAEGEPAVGIDDNPPLAGGADPPAATEPTPLPPPSDSPRASEDPGDPDAPA